MKRTIRTVRLRIAGRVQGVGYRLWAIDTAARLGLRGWVRNRADGTVEAAIEGPPEAVDTLMSWMRTGPPGAVVESVEVFDEEPEGLTGFTIVR
jgi:acylphosphatase